MVANIARLLHLVGVEVAPHRVCYITAGLLDQPRDKGKNMLVLAASKRRNDCPGIVEKSAKERLTLKELGK